MPGLRHRALRGETSSTVLATSAATETPTARKASVLRPPSEANTANSQHGPHARLLLCSPGPAWRRWYPPPHCPHRAHGRPGSQGSQGSGAFLCATPPTPPAPASSPRAPGTLSAMSPLPAHAELGGRALHALVPRPGRRVPSPRPSDGTAPRSLPWQPVSLSVRPEHPAPTLSEH